VQSCELGAGGFVCGVWCGAGADGKKHSGKLSQWNVVEALLQNTLVEVSRSG
jgi:hypothetical protein